MGRVVEGLVPALPTDTFVTFSKCKRQIKPKTFGDCVTTKIDAKWVKKDNSNSIKIGCTMLDGAFVRNGYNQQKIVRQIKPKTFGDCVTINPVEKHKANNKKCLTIPYSRTTQYQNSFLKGLCACNCVW
jgi:hypothetical protein